MAARIRRGTSHEGWVEQVKERIRTSMLVNRMIDHALGKIELTSTQVRCIEIALRKTLPDLSASENKSEVTVRNVVRVPEKAISTETWQQEHDPAPTIQ